ncbi:MULE domain-containing protein [Trichonephila clavipes]|nr:MULE domain-containing protein [Trichonephila clavipes]
MMAVLFEIGGVDKDRSGSRQRSAPKFVTWKEEENKSRSKYVRQRGCKTLKNGEIVMNYHCCRSGIYKPQGKGLRNLKTQGSAKIGISCPAVIKGFVNGILETGGVMDKCVQMWTKNYGALGQTARVCFGVGQVCPDVDKELRRLGPDGSGVFWRVMRQ